MSYTLFGIKCYLISNDAYNVDLGVYRSVRTAAMPPNGLTWAKKKFKIKNKINPKNLKAKMFPKVKGLLVFLIQYVYRSTGNEELL